jgi:nicotinate-nucleotide adenylyltransferase
MNIAVYSGSFNPLHIGHLAIIKYMVEVAGFDMVYLIVSPKNPLKDGISSDSGTDRYNAAVQAVNRHFAITDVACCGDDMPPPARGCSSRRSLAVGVIGATATSDLPKVRVDDIELTMPEPHYTISTLDALRAREPENNFTFVMGADNLADIRRWRDYSRILAEHGVAVYPRSGFALETIKQDLLSENPAYKIQIINAPMVDISSTQIREALSRGEDVSHLLM